LLPDTESRMTASASLASPLDLTLRAQRDLLRDGRLSAAEAVAAYAEEAEKRKNLNVFITSTHEQALKRARDADARLARGEARPLEGVAIAVKDNYCTAGVRTTAASRILGNFVPAYESTVTQRLLDAGAVMLGKTNMDEFAMGSSTETSHFGATINPAGEDRGFPDLAPGGSSGGSAAAVAARLAPAALGSDTGGSIRQPASFCGTVGFKPTYGVCSRWGIIAYGSSLDQAGVFTRDIADAAVLMDVIAGHDPKDTTSWPRDDYAFAAALRKPAAKLRIGFPREYREAGSTPETVTLWAEAERLAREIGAEIFEVSIPSARYSLPAYYIIALSEASSNLARYDGVKYGYRAPKFENLADMYEQTRAQGFGAQVKRRIMLGTFTLSAGYYDAYYLKAQKVRAKIAAEFAAAFAAVDFLFMPTAPTGAFAIGSHNADPVQMFLEDIFTVPINLAGLPALSLPVARDARGMPLGLQIVGPQFSDERLLRAAADVEKAAAFTL